MRSRIAQTDSAPLLSGSHPRTRYDRDSFEVQFRSTFSMARIFDRINGRRTKGFLFGTSLRDRSDDLDVSADISVSSTIDFYTLTSGSPRRALLRDLPRNT